MAAVIEGIVEGLIPNLIDRNPDAHGRRPMDMIRHGSFPNLSHAVQK